MILYLSGPMRGYPEFNYPAFHAAADKLRAAGFTVLNPADYGAAVTDWVTCLRRDLHDVLDAEAVAVLPGWEASQGATLETDVARRLGMAIMPVDYWLAATASGNGDMMTAEATGFEPGLSELTLAALRAESIRAHTKHGAAEHGGRTLLGDVLPLEARFAALAEEVGEAADAFTCGDKDARVKELIQTANVAASWAQYEEGQADGVAYTLSGTACMLIELLAVVGEVGRALTYDGGGKAAEHPADQQRVVAALTEVRKVAEQWMVRQDSLPR